MLQVPPGREPARGIAAEGASLLDELRELDEVVADAPQVERLTCGSVEFGERTFPIPVFALGRADVAAPAAGFFGGFHGLERIGTHVVIAFLASLVARLRWDDLLQRQLESMRLLFVPLVNPVGMWRGTRANGNGVDLMRNAPIDADAGVPHLIGGQRRSASLPWYRGRPGEPMEAENRLVCDVVARELTSRPFSLAVDCHSGFGMQDRLWFPFAHTARPFGHLAEMDALLEAFEQAHPHHRYIIEPQSRQYLAHGDLWDHIYLDSTRTAGGVFLPLTLEMGSWSWIRKNPRQILSRHGIFNPVALHRQRRTLRRHGVWLDFAARAACSYERWMPAGEARSQRAARALERWHGGPPR
jgi:hypothetical protein